MKNETLSNTTMYLLATIPLIRLLSNCQAFEKYVKSRAGPPLKLLWQGFRKVFLVLMYHSLFDLERTYDLGFTTNRETERAIFDGVPMEIRPIETQKARITKNVSDALRKIRRAKTYKQFCKEIQSFTSKYTPPLNKIFTNCVEIPERFGDKEKVLKALALDVLLTYCHDMRRAPEIRGVVDLYTDKPDQKTAKLIERLQPLIIGYKFGLAYIWGALWDSKLGESPTDSILAAKSWDEIDALFSTINSEQIGQLGTHLGTYPHTIQLRLVRKPDLRRFGVWLRSPPSPTLTKYQEIDQLFLWYDFEIMYEARAKLFSGVRTFVTMLMGEIQHNLISGVPGKLEVLRLRHGQPGNSSYSYAILVEGGGSGWLIFLNCCTDYSGYGNYLRKEAERVIERFSKYLHVVEANISMKELDYFFKQRYALEKEEKVFYGTRQRGLVPAMELQKLRAEMNQSLGLLLELLTAIWLTEIGFQVEWDAKLEKLQIDIIAEKEEVLLIVECQMSLPRGKRGLEKLVEEYKRKKRLVQKTKGPKKSIDKLLVYSAKHSIECDLLEETGKLQKQGILAFPIEAILKASRHSSKEIIRLFETTVTKRFPPLRIPSRWRR